MPCSAQTLAESTVCYPDGTDLAFTCPITDIKFVEHAGVQKYKALGYTEVKFNHTTSIVYSKNAPNLPITTTAIEDKPCLDSSSQSNSHGQTFYDPELM